MKNRMKRRVDKIPLLLFLWCIVLCWLFVWRQGVFGSKIDWISQHSVLPDYFRQLFYETGNLCPNFAPHIGGGQNLFHLSYYGLLNPVILISYFLPFVKMSDYIMVSSMICYGLSVVTFYYWIRKKCSHRFMAAGIAGMFSLAAPLLYHSYNQIMFVNYMPFLCLALIGTDAYLKKRKSGLFIIGTVGMILSSFYFSIGGMLALVLYAVSEYLKMQENITVRQLIVWLVRYSIYLILAVLMCGILLVPTAFALGGGRSQGLQPSLSWLIPELNLGKLVFNPHGIGLSILAIVVLVRGLFYKTWKERFLSIAILCLLIVPAFGYLLNGGLYSKTKVFIPFLPIVCYLFIPFLNDIAEKYRQMIAIVVPSISIVVLLVVDYGIHTEAKAAVSKEFYQKVTSQTSVSWIDQETEKDLTFYRTEEIGGKEENKANINRIHCLNQSISSIYSSAYSTRYSDFRINTFLLDEPFRNHMMQSVTDNPCFLKFMGVKHLITQEKIPGYTLDTTSNANNLWTNEDVIPLIYSTSHVLDESVYQKISFPENQTALLQTAVVQDANTNHTDIESVFHEIPFQLPESENKTLAIHPVSGGYEIVAKDETELMLVIKKESKDDLVAASFLVENQSPEEDMHIMIENQQNLLTAKQHEYANHNVWFTYLLGVEQDQQQIKLTFGKGNYVIHDIKFFAGSWETLKDTSLCQHSFIPKTKQWKTKWDGTTYWKGTLQAEKDSHLITSIPYDPGFTIFVDGTKTETEVVNTAFLGCRLTEGNHKIEIRYKAKGYNYGVLLTVIGDIIFWYIIIANKKRKGYEEVIGVD